MVIAAGVLALHVTVASAESVATVDCVQHGRLTRHYSDAELRNALTTMPAEIKEYNSECYQLIQNQLNAQIGTTTVSGGTTGTGGGSGSSLISTPLLIVLGVVVLAGGGFALGARRRG